jgi:hypothetical protein
VGKKVALTKGPSDVIRMKKPRNTDNDAGTRRHRNDRSRARACRVSRSSTVRSPKMCLSTTLSVKLGHTGLRRRSPVQIIDSSSRFRKHDDGPSNAGRLADASWRFRYARRPAPLGGWLWRSLRRHG